MATRAARLRQVPRFVWIITFAVVVGLIAAVAVAFATGSGSDQSNGPSKLAVTTPSTQASTTPTTTTAPTTTTPTLAPGEDRLSTASRLGYAGLGPIKLGVTLGDAEKAGDVTIVAGDCPWVVHPGPDSGLAPVVMPYGTITGYTVWAASGVVDQIDVTNPATSTISGVHVGSTYDDVLRTYPSAVETIIGQDSGSSPPLSLTITNPEGRVIVFYLGADRVVDQMTVAFSQGTINANIAC